MRKTLALFSLLLLNALPAFAACSHGSCPFPLDLTPLKKLKTNSQLSHYQIKKMNAHTATATATLADGSKLEVTLKAGDAWSKIDRKITSLSAHAPKLSHKKYWLEQALFFAHTVWAKNDYEWLQKAVKNPPFSNGKLNSQENTLSFEQYSEANFTQIRITKTKTQIIIELQRSSC